MHVGKLERGVCMSVCVCNMHTHLLKLCFSSKVYWEKLKEGMSWKSISQLVREVLDWDFDLLWAIVFPGNFQVGVFLGKEYL